MAEKRLLERVREALRVRHYSLATERVYVMWVRRFILFHGKRHPAGMGKREVEAFLTHLAVTRGVSPSTQNQALQPILFMYLKVLEQDLPWLDNVVRAKPKRRIPVVLSADEVARLLARIAPNQALPAALRRKLGTSTRDFHWQYLFPGGRRSEDPRAAEQWYRWHVHPDTVRSALCRRWTGCDVG